MIAIGQCAQPRMILSSERAIHEREARLISHSIRRLRCEVHITRGDLRGDANDPDDLIALCNEPGLELLVEAEGPESERALDLLVHLAEKGEGFIASHASLGVFGLIDQGGHGPDSLLSLGDLTPREELDAMGLRAPHSRRSEDLRSLASLSPRDALGAFALLG